MWGSVVNWGEAPSLPVAGSNPAMNSQIQPPPPNEGATRHHSRHRRTMADDSPYDGHVPLPRHVGGTNPEIHGESWSGQRSPTRGRWIVARAARLKSFLRRAHPPWHISVVHPSPPLSAHPHCPLQQIVSILAPPLPRQQADHIVMCFVDPIGRMLPLPSATDQPVQRRDLNHVSAFCLFLPQLLCARLNLLP